MASTKRKTIHLFNCDNLCDLSEADVVEKTIPNLRGLDYAVFVVHAHECSLAFTEESPYGKIYKALKKRAGLGKFSIYVQVSSGIVKFIMFRTYVCFVYIGSL